MSLPHLPNVTKLSRYVTRILGQNPGRYSLQGTNTYLIHDPDHPTSLILLDTAQGIPSYLPLVTPFLSSPSPLSIQIVLSHWHQDHVGGLKDVLEVLKGQKWTIWKHATSGGEEEKDQDRELEEVVRRIVEGGDKGDESAHSAAETLVKGGRIRALKQGQKLKIGNVELDVLHTPGHTTDSISLLLSAPESDTKLFTFDTVLGHGTAVFGDLGAYMASLNYLLEKMGKEGEGETEVYPGHGETIKEGRAKVGEYLRHRQEREDQVVEALKVGRGGGGKVLKASDLTEHIYASTIPDELKPAATRGLLLHLNKLEKDGQVQRKEAPGSDKDEAPLPGWNDGWKWVGSGSERASPNGAKI
ncbi:BZ3500_MvSof-1268-A1-R1_Chr4-3g07394 [Microbotryum saponariae]|uniref:BZ3500_MvSof-1268-A1-R1_Chr4-3g07394 protein n=1 Tax=Microbotryum saponariae TaxID=289078 RepID=A0A2X0KU67_9BASI|nr:BZ3500_MvSof-1268-A1-R1_Chr4-3g07394 [Microbotryum saponariae]SDA07057.1 BZ3501_MvSof-1269-A2-R1_Chr4-2g07103 [Microbotryum saponariae]